MEAPLSTSDALTEAIGADRAAEVLDALRSAGLDAVPADELALLRRQAAGYRRMEALVTGPPPERD